MLGSLKGRHSKDTPQHMIAGECDRSVSMRVPARIVTIIVTDWLIAVAMWF